MFLCHKWWSDKIPRLGWGGGNPRAHPIWWSREVGVGASRWWGQGRCRPPPPTRPPGPSAFPVFVASEFEIHGLLTSSALSPPTRACLCVLSLDFVTVPLPRLSFVFSSWGVRVSPSFPFLLLGLRVRVCVCVSVSVSAFESPALFSQQRLPGFVLPVPRK